MRLAATINPATRVGAMPGTYHRPSGASSVDRQRLAFKALRLRNTRVISTACLMLMSSFALSMLIMMFDGL